MNNWSIEPFLGPWKSTYVDPTEGARKWQELAEQERQGRERADYYKQQGRVAERGQDLNAEWHAGQNAERAAAAKDKKNARGGALLREYRLAVERGGQDNSYAKAIKSQMEAEGFSLNEFVEPAATPTAIPPQAEQPAAQQEAAPSAPAIDPLGMTGGTKPSPVRVNEIGGAPSFESPGKPQYAPGEWGPIDPMQFPLSIDFNELKPPTAAPDPRGVPQMTQFPTYQELDSAQQPPAPPQNQKAVAPQMSPFSPAVPAKPSGVYQFKNKDGEVLSTFQPGTGAYDQVEEAFAVPEGATPEMVDFQNIGRRAMTVGLRNGKSYDEAFKEGVAARAMAIQMRGQDLNARSRVAAAGRAEAGDSFEQEKWYNAEVDRAVKDMSTLTDYKTSQKALDVVDMAKQELEDARRSPNGVMDFNVMKNIIKTTDPRQTDRDVMQMQQSGGMPNYWKNFWNKYVNGGRMTPEFIAGLEGILDATEKAANRKRDEVALRVYKTIDGKLRRLDPGTRALYAMEGATRIAPSFVVPPGYKQAEDDGLPKTIRTGGKSAVSGSSSTDTSGPKAKKGDIGAVSAPAPWE